MRYIGFTGHRDIHASDEERIRQELFNTLHSFQNESRRIKLIIGDADGADTICREVAESLSIRTILFSAVADEINHLPGESIFEKQANHLVEHCTDIITVWDGIFTHKAGGTSDVIHKAITSGKRIKIHHLITPRVANPHPVASLLGDVIDFHNKQFKRIPFAVHFSWLTAELPLTEENKQWAWLSWLWDKIRSSVFWVYILPILLVIITLVVGSIGFAEKLPCYSPDNIFFKAVGLITLEDSVIEGTSNEYLNFSRFTGLAIVVIVFIYGFYLALAKQRKDVVRWFWKKRKNFTLILGLNEKSYDLITDLSFQRENIVLLNQHKESIYVDELKKNRNVIIVNGNLFSGKTLKKLYINQAREIFVLSESDSDNIRATQEIDLLTLPSDGNSTVNRFVHISDDAKKKFLQKSINRESSSRTNIFNVYENTVRRLLLYHPVDRFYQSPGAKHAHAVIIGFDALGKQLTLNLLKQGHYTRDKFLSIHVLCNDSAAEKAQFIAKYPQFDIDAYSEKADGSDGDVSVKTYTWQNVKLTFDKLPISERDWLHDESTIFKHIAQNQIVSIYACLPDGIESATYLSVILPKIDYRKVEQQCNLQVFCYYNFPDKKEEQIIEDQFNKLAPNTYITCFGNFLDEYSSKAIHNMALDALPKLINANYSNIAFTDGVNEKRIEEEWRNLSESHKSSSRQAADHLWVKIRLIWPEIDWKFNPQTFELNDEVKTVIFKEKLNEYGEIEHRRWCAELLLGGFSPITEDTDSEDYHAIATHWNSKNPEDKAMKASYQARFEHIDLLPFDKLKDHEAEKDLKQLQAIPTFLRAIVKTD